MKLTLCFVAILSLLLFVINVHTEKEMNNMQYSCALHSTNNKQQTGNGEYVIFCACSNIEDDEDILTEMIVFTGGGDDTSCSSSSLILTCVTSSDLFQSNICSYSTSSYSTCSRIEFIAINNDIYYVIVNPFNDINGGVELAYSISGSRHIASNRIIWCRANMIAMNVFGSIIHHNICVCVVPLSITCVCVIPTHRGRSSSRDIKLCTSYGSLRNMTHTLHICVYVGGL